MNHGLWMNLKNAGIEPKPEDAINQLQELYQKKYVEQPVYTFEEIADGWRCDCLCGGVNGYGSAAGKTAAKKKAAFMVLRRLMMSAGLATEERRYARETQQEAVEPVRNPGNGKISVPDFPAARGMLGGVTF